MKKILIYSFIIYFQLIFNSISNEIKILYKVNNGIITNQDVIEEINYLVSLNQNLSQLNNEQLSSNAQKSLIREKIKKDEVNKFYEVKKLDNTLSVPIEICDERLTTVTAERSLREQGVTSKDGRKVVDQLAASILLQAWLDSRRNLED